MIGWFFRFCLRLRQSSFHWIISDGVISGVGRKWERSDSSDSDCVKLMTPLMTPIFDFHYVISALTTTTPTPTPTPSLVKTSLKICKIVFVTKGVCSSFALVKLLFPLKRWKLVWTSSCVLRCLSFKKCIVVLNISKREFFLNAREC